MPAPTLTGTNPFLFKDNTMASRWLAQGDAPRSQFLNDGFQRRLAHWNRERLAPAFPTADWQKRLERDVAHAAPRRRVPRGTARRGRRRGAPPRRPTPTASSPGSKTLKETGPGQDDPLFPWLAEEATLDEIRWFLDQEAAGEAGFDDLVAMTQVKLPARAKMELARNYWDEMGRGNIKGMHGPMLDAPGRDARARPGDRKYRRGKAWRWPTR